MTQTDLIDTRKTLFFVGYTIVLGFVSFVDYALLTTPLDSHATLKSDLDHNSHCWPYRHIAFDAIRVSGPDQHGAPPHLMAFLWVFGWVGAVSGMCLLVVTWISFSSKNLLARPALTGSPALFWGIEVPYILSSIALPIISGVSYWCYFIAMRVCICSWSAMFLVLALFASYYGYQTLSKLSNGGDSFNYRQQMRVLVVLVFTLGGCGICLGVQGFFLDKIDNFYQIFLLCTSLYRVCGFTLCAGSALYVWIATMHWIEVTTSGHTTTSQGDSRKRSAGSVVNTDKPSSSESTSTSEEEEGSPEVQV